MVLALAVEAAFFLATGSPAFRDRLAEVPPLRLALAMSAVSACTWLVAGGGEPWQFAGAVVAAGALAFWYPFLGRSLAADYGLMALYGALALGKVSMILYPVAWAKAPTPFVGELAWLRTLIIAVLVFRKAEGIGYGFWPAKREWVEGFKWFLLMLAPVGAAVYLTGFLRLRDLPDDAGRVALSIAATFAGHFVFVALREEFLFRGMLLPRAGIVITSVVFGLVHLPFKEFPNWKFAVIAGLAGWFYARSYQATSSIRSAMVTHALTNVVFRVFLTN